MGKKGSCKGVKNIQRLLFLEFSSIVAKVDLAVKKVDQFLS